MKKRGYLFVLDAMVALGVLTLGILLLFSFHRYEPSTQQSYTVSVNVLKILSDDRIKDINNPYMGANSVLTRNGNIIDLDKTLLEQIGEFYYRGEEEHCEFCKDLIGSFMDNLTGDLIPEELNFMLKIENETVYMQKNLPLNESRLILPSRKITYGLFEEDIMYGPYVVEVLSWK